MEKNRYGGFRFDGDKVMKGSKAIGERRGDLFLQEKTYPRHFLRKYRGFGVSLGLLYLLLDNEISVFKIDIVKRSGDLKTIFDSTSEEVVELFNSKKVQYPGFDEQRLFKWEPKKMEVSSP